jgi:CheY-like chemotaxis protein
MATILVVDDRPQNRAHLTRLIGHNGHRMIEADDGARALEQVRKEQPDLVITDFLMPTMDGYEFVADQAKILRLLRCDQAQGYLFGRPIPFDQVTALLSQEGKG